MSSEEEKYIARREAQKKEDAMRERQLEAIKDQERDKIKGELETTDELAQEALELGFDSTTARVLPLIPLIEVAWADGTVTSAENRTVLELAEKYGIEAGSPSHNFLKMLLFEEPSDVFFERVNRVIAHLVSENPEHWSDMSVIELSKQVAQASGGLFGLLESVSEEEREVIEELAELFSVQDKSARRIEPEGS